MKDLRSKQHYQCKIHTSLMVSSAPPIYRQPPSYMDYSYPFYTPPLYRQSPIWITPILTKKYWSPLLWFFINLNLLHMMSTLKSRSFQKFEKNSARTFLRFSSGPSFIIIWETIHNYDDFYYKLDLLGSLKEFLKN